MSYSVQPYELIGLAERMRRAFDDVHEIACALQTAADTAALALARAVPAHPAFIEFAEGRVDLVHRIVARGRAAVSALQTAVLAYLVADDEMESETDATALTVTNPFDPIAFGRRRL